MRFERHTTPTAATVEERPTRLWSPSQLVALVLGGAALAFGVLALTRTGLDLSHLTRNHDSVLGFDHTPLLGLAEIGFGILMVLAAFGPVAGRNLMTLLGAAAIGLGVVIVAGWWSARLTHWLGASDRNAWLFITVGGVAMLAAFFAPVWTTGGPRVVREPALANAAKTDTVPRAPGDGITPDAPPSPRRRRFLPRVRRHDEPARVPEAADQ